MTDCPHFLQYIFLSIPVLLVFHFDKEKEIFPQVPGKLNPGLEVLQELQIDILLLKGMIYYE
jgi:hypothetical protein